MASEQMDFSDSADDPYRTSGDDDSDYQPSVGHKKQKKMSNYFPLEEKNKDNRDDTKSSSSIAKTRPKLQPTNYDETLSVPDETILLKIKNSPMLDGKFFQVTGEATDVHHIKAICQMCLPETKIIKGSIEVTTNFVKHMKTKHIKNYESYVKYKKEKKNERISKITTYGDGDISDSSASSSKSYTVNKPNIIKTNKVQSQISFSRLNQKIFDERVVRFIIETMSPISIISHPTFINMFEGMHVKVLNRFAAVKKIDGIYQKMIQDIKLDLSKCAFVCTTADIWSCKRRSFIGVTCHWINDMLERKSVALSCRRFEGTHSYDRIAEILDDIYKAYDLEGKILATITDNGSNFVKCFQEFGVSTNKEDTHTNTEQVSESETEALITDLENVVEETEIVSDLQFANVTEFSESTSSEHISLSQHLRCASHTLNLIATTDYKNSLLQNSQLKNKHTSAFNKCSNLWKKAGRPKSAEIIHNCLGHTLSYPGVTRWNSLYDATNQILICKEKLNELCDKLLIPTFTQYDILFLEEYVRIMKPIAETLDFLQGDQNTYYGYLLPSIISLFTKLEKIKLSLTMKYLTKPLEYILDSLKKRFKILFTLESKMATIAAVTIPKFKMRWFSGLNSHEILFSTKDIQSWILQAAIELEENHQSEVCTGEDTKEKEQDPFFDFNEEPSTSASLSLITSISSSSKKNQYEFEIIKYLNDPRSNIGMLDDYRTIKKIFVKYNSIIPSSAPVERLFSFAQIVNAPRRHALSDTNFEKLVLLKSNAFR